jgi:phosphatidylinositol dimannoside acyltransferase
MDMLKRLKTEARDLVELLVLPGLAAVMPWPMCYFIFKLVAKWKYPYRATCEAALHQAEQRGWANDPVQWIQTRRLITLIDHADYYLARTRSDSWMNKYLEVHGTWPNSDTATILCTFHWGAGMWGLRHAASRGLKPYALVAPLEGAHFSGRSVLRKYAFARTEYVAMVLRQPVLEVSSSLRPIVRALKANQHVLAAIDAPADQVAMSETIEFLGLHARVPRALFRLAIDQGVPVTLYITGLHLKDGKRFLRILSINSGSNVDELIMNVFSQLENLIKEQPAAWHFWAEANRFFVSDVVIGVD